jgi:hypothetical protein
MVKRRRRPPETAPVPRPKKARARANPAGFPGMAADPRETEWDMPLHFATHKHAKLQRSLENWQAACCQIPKLVLEGARLIEPWITLVIRESNGMVLAQSLDAERPSTETLWALLTEAMEQPNEGRPHRPARLKVQTGSILCELRALLEKIEVEYVEEEELDELEYYLEGLAEHLTHDDEPGLLDTPGVTPERVASFYQAAAAFYRKAPWTNVSDADAILVECDQLEGGPWHAIVMGWGGITIGLGLFDDLVSLHQLREGNPEGGDNLPKALSVTFDPEMQIPAVDLLAARKYGWEVAGPEAYPWAFRAAEGPSMVPLVAWELDLLEACLRAIPKFVAQNQPRDLALARTTVPVASGTRKLKLVLSWVEDE